jgi:hypothetical protein
MTTAFTAIPVKITKSTIRFFLGGCMAGLFDFQGNENIPVLSPVYSNACVSSINMDQSANLFRG